MKKFFTSIPGLVVSAVVLAGTVYVIGWSWKKSQEKKPVAAKSDTTTTATA